MGNIGKSTANFFQYRKWNQFWEKYDDKKEDLVIANIEESINVNGVFIDQKPAYNKIINFKVPLQLDQKVVA